MLTNFITACCTGKLLTQKSHSVCNSGLSPHNCFVSTRRQLASIITGCTEFRQSCSQAVHVLDFCRNKASTFMLASCEEHTESCPQAVDVLHLCSNKANAFMLTSCACAGGGLGEGSVPGSEEGRQRCNARHLPHRSAECVSAPSE